MSQSHSSIRKPKTATVVALRLCDLCIAVPMALLFAIPMLIAALAIWLEDRDSVLFKQIRVGQGTRPFKIFKFRTMYTDKSRMMGDEHKGAPSEEARAQFQTTSANDSRITKVGKVLRPTHMDELPQLLNVVLGHMSLVGVRPDVPVQEADYTPEVWQDRHLLRPGITGFAQVDSTVETTEQRTAQDLRWVRNASVAAYVQTLLKTVTKVLKRNSL
ncbi:sugar transferase [Tropicibacter sp. Alg240-R139]|uniref:sugar transferase n=1 Tax=Tropicibacter sp. Alg240-R139 TaxID=2305991 RepID=UPI0013DEB683|nr:sugar transferase [Tropicibacter sp. Alg240-R139]